MGCRGVPILLLRLFSFLDNDDRMSSKRRNLSALVFLINLITKVNLIRTFTFVQDIQGLSMHGKFMVSFDIVSLFTNIPLEECIDLAVKYISDGDPDIKLSNTELKSLFSVATAQTHFLFKGSFYDQIDGVAMGSPLAPVLSNLFMGHHEKLWLENFQDSEILF